MNSEILNKSMDYEDVFSPSALVLTDKLNTLIKDLRERNLQCSSWYGDFFLDKKSHNIRENIIRKMEQLNRAYDYKPLDENAGYDRYFPWYLYWEIYWLTENNQLDKNHKILDLGGSSSLFSYYLASEGLDVTTIDIQEELVDNANRVAEAMEWNLKNHAMDIRDMTLDGQFDHIFSVSVYEHIPIQNRIEINRKVNDLLRPGGCFSMTFDYRNPSKDARFGSQEDIVEQFVKPSGLRMRGNQAFLDNGKNYLINPFFHKECPFWLKLVFVVIGKNDIGDVFKLKDENDYSFGALFLEKA